MSHAEALITVVIPVFNAEKYIDATLDSLAKQTLSPELFEVVVVDDGSTDASADIVNNFNAPFRLTLVRQANAGAAKARNVGVQSSNAQYIAFLDSDATAAPTWLQTAITYFQNSEIAAVEGRIEARGGVTPPTPYTHILQNETGGRFLTCNMLFRRSVFLEVGGFDENFPFFLEDSDLAFAVLKKGLTIKYARDVVVFHPRIKKTLKYFWWQNVTSAFRIPLLFAKHPEVIRNCRKYGIPWHTMTACPVYFYGYYAAVLLAAASLMAPVFFPWPLGMEAKWFGLSCAFLGFLFSYAFTLYARLRKRAWVWREVWPLLIAYLVIPFARVYWLVRGAIHFRVRYPFP